MKRNAKASAAGSTHDTIGGRRLFRRASADPRDSKVTDAPAATKLILGLGLALVASFAFAAPALAAPAVSLDTATPSYTTIELAGTVDAGSAETEVYAEYAESSSGPWTFSFIQTIPAASGPTLVQTTIPALTPGTDYFVRLDGFSEGVETYSAEPYPSVHTLPVGAPIASIDAPSAVAGASAHFSGEINPEAPAGDPGAFDVNWHFDCSPACPGLSGTIAADSASHIVEADPEDLQPGTAYQVRLVAENVANTTTAGPVGFSTLALVPSLVNLRADSTNTEAGLVALVNPGGLVTRYHFDWGATRSYGNSTPVSTLAATGIPVTAHGYINGLLPGSEYHFRLVASNLLGEVISEDQVFATRPVPKGDCLNGAVRQQQRSQSLPDCRAYELVTPGAAKLGGGVGGSLALIPAQVASSGERVTYPAPNPFGDPANGMAVLGNSIAYEAERAPGGWNSTFVSNVPAPTPALQVTSFFPLWLGSSPDLSRNFLEVDYRGFPGFTSGAWATKGGSSGLLLAAKDESGATTSTPTVVGSADDGSRAVISSPTPEDGGPLLPAGAEWPIYQETATGLSLVNVDDQGNLLNISGAVLASRGTTPGLGALGTPRHAVSADGSRIAFFSQRPGAAAGEPSSLYLRVDDSRTFELSASIVDPTAAAEPTSFVGASRDGTRVYFATGAKLLPGATGSGPFLYVYELPKGAPTGELKLVAGVDHPVSMTAPTPFGPVTDFANVAISDDGWQVFYANEEAGGSIYSLDRRTGITRLVASGVSDVSLASVSNGQYYPNPDISPDGHFLAFISTAELAPGETNPGRKLYLYNSTNGLLRLLTPSNKYTPPSFDIYFFANTNEATLTPDRLPAETNFVSDAGDYVFFGTKAPLVAADTNGRPDVYSWHNGELALLTPGNRPEGAFLIGASASGRDSFFYTTGDLVSNDGDDKADIYDARIDGGFISTEGTECEGEGCQGQISSAPAPAALGSSTLGGPAAKHKPRHQKHKKHKKHKRGKKAAKNAGHRSGKSRRKARDKRATNKRHQRADSSMAAAHRIPRSLVEKGDH